MKSVKKKSSDSQDSIELIPEPAVIREIKEESRDVKSFLLELENGKKIDSKPGQFIELSIQGHGEATFAISRILEDKSKFYISVKRMGHLTKMLHRSSVEEIVGIRGPYGRPFPTEKWKNRDIVIAGGGIGLAPLRPVVDSILENHSDFGNLEVIFGARSPRDMLFEEDLAKWESIEEVKLHRTIDTPHEGWTGKVGFVPSIIGDLGLKPDSKIAVVCGPPIMIKLSVETLENLGWEKEQIYTTLEMKMQCGVGQCGRCNIKDKLICRDGPVFRLDEIR